MLINSCFAQHKVVYPWCRLATGINIVSHRSNHKLVRISPVLLRKYPTNSLTDDLGGCFPKVFHQNTIAVKHWLEDRWHSWINKLANLLVVVYWPLSPSRKMGICRPSASFPKYPTGAVITINPLTLRDMTLTRNVVKRLYLFCYFHPSLLLTQKSSDLQSTLQSTQVCFLRSWKNSEYDCW